jgi:hypothetical protein
MLSGDFPFKGEYVEDIMIQIKEGQINFEENNWSLVSDQAKDLILLLLKNDPL